MSRHVLPKLFMIVGLLLAILLPGAAPALAAAPPNDDFDDALVISALPFTHTQSLSEATVASDDPSTCRTNNRSAWYTFTPDETMYIDVGLNNQLAVLSVYTGTRGALTQVQCYSFPPRFRMQVMVGQTYFFMAQDLNASTTFSIARTPPPPTNDDFDSAIVVSALPFSHSADIGLATSSPDDPGCGGKTLWYVYTPTIDQQVEVIKFGLDSTWGVYTGTRGNLSEVVCYPNYQANAVVDLHAGITYYFMSGSRFYTGVNALYHGIELRDMPPPVEIESTIDFKGTLDPTSGRARIQGTYSCDRPVNGTIGVQLTQTIGHVESRGGDIVALECDGATPSTWSAAIFAHDNPFSPGPVDVVLYFRAYDEVSGRWTYVTASGTVYLHTAPPKYK